MPDVPLLAKQRLQLLWRENAERNLLLTGELVRVLTALASDGVQAVPFRGPVLAKRAYGDIRLRQFNDLDVLVRRGDVSRASACLASLGYREWDRSSVPVRTREQVMHHRVFSPNQGRALLELHWQITPRWFGYALDAGAWGRLDRLELAGQQVAVLAAEDLLISHCLHGALHGWTRLAWIADVARVLAAEPSMDWERLGQLAERQGARRALYLGLLLAQDLLGLPLPPGVVQAVGDDGIVRGLAAGVKHKLSQKAQAPGGAAPRFPLAGLHLALRVRWSQKVAHLLRVALVPSHEDWALVRLSPRFSFLYYLIRPLRLLGKHATRIVRRGRD
jgi:hypothetical protein